MPHNDEVSPAEDEGAANMDRREFLGELAKAAVGAVAIALGSSHSEAQAGVEAPTAESVRRHVEAGGVEWPKASVMLEQHRLDCIDGRCEDCVAGTPGGDMGNLFLELTAAEQVSGQPIDDAAIGGIFKRYLGRRTGPFYMHTDEHALDNLAVAMKTDRAGIERLLKNPGDRRDELLEALQQPNNVGCGHVKLMLKDNDKYPGDRPDLLKGLIREFFDAKWKGGNMDYVVLRGAHAEGAVVQVTMDGELTEDSPVPLIKPHVGDSSVFVVYPQVEKLSERKFAESASELLDRTIDPVALKNKMSDLRGHYLRSSAEALAAGKPVFTLHYDANRNIRVTA